MQHSTKLFNSCVFHWNTAANEKEAHGENLANTDLSFKRQKKKKREKNKQTNKQIRENVQLSHHRQQIRTKEPPCLYMTQQHTLVSHEWDKYS